MGILDKIISIVNNAEVASAYKPTKPYTGKLPTKTVKKGSKGSDVKAVQSFLNWCIGSGLKADGSCGSKTVSAIKKWQKKYGLTADGSFGAKSRAKAKKIVDSYKPSPQPTPPKPTPTPVQTRWTKANAWAKKIADSKYHYVIFTSSKKTQTCPICKGRKYNDAYGWNCIGAAFAYWRHGAGIPCRCCNHTISNENWEKIFKAKSSAEALKIARKSVGINDITVIRGTSSKSIAKAKWHKGDICAMFKGNKYIHTFVYTGNEKVFDSTRSGGVGSKDNIKFRGYKNYSAKVIIRYTGK